MTELSSVLAQAAKVTATVRARLLAGVIVSDDVLCIPLWSTLIEQPGKRRGKIRVETRRRYLTSLLALRLRIATAGLAESETEQLDALHDEQWQALEHAHRRNVSVAKLQKIVAMSPAERQACAVYRRLRLGERTCARLASLRRVHWKVLERLGEIPPRTTIAALEELPADDRAALRQLSTQLGAGATFDDLAAVDECDWALLSQA